MNMTACCKPVSISGHKCCALTGNAQGSQIRSWQHGWLDLEDEGQLVVELVRKHIGKTDAFCVRNLS